VCTRVEAVPGRGIAIALLLLYYHCLEERLLFCLSLSTTSGLLLLARLLLAPLLMVITRGCHARSWALLGVLLILMAKVRCIIYQHVSRGSICTIEQRNIRYTLLDLGVCCWVIPSILHTMPSSNGTC
jgi:predicted ABC-type exoprotein transport system permease subunit